MAASLMKNLTTQLHASRHALRSLTANYWPSLCFSLLLVEPSKTPIDQNFAVRPERSWTCSAVP